MRIKARYRKLAHQIAAIEMERQAECQHTRDLLESYVEAELSCEDARALYPRVWDHLQDCPRCREQYEQLTKDTEE